MKPNFAGHVQKCALLTAILIGCSEAESYDDELVAMGGARGSIGAGETVSDSRGEQDEPLVSEGSVTRPELGESARDSVVSDLETVIGGCVQNISGSSLAGIRVLCCSEEICRSEETGTNGCYRVDGVGSQTRFKMQLSDPEGVLMTLIYFQEGIPGEETQLSEPVVLPPREGDMQRWSAEVGGDVVLASGALALSAAPGSLIYPIGAEEALMAQELETGHQPPYASRPWLESEGSMTDIIAFAFMPLEVHAKRRYCRAGLCRKPCSGLGECRGGAACQEDACMSEEDVDACLMDHECGPPLEFRLEDDRLGESGELWQVYSLDPLSAELKDSGLGVVDELGHLVSGPENRLYDISTLIFVRLP